MYGYCANSPVRYTDPDGCIPIDTIWDIGCTVFDTGVAIYKSTKGDYSGWIDVGLDAAAILIPYVPAGVSKLKNIAQTTSNVNNGIKVATKTIKQSVWSLPQFERGWKIEEMLGGMLNNFPVIDYFSKKAGSNVAQYMGSIKSMNLNAQTYQDARNVYNRLIDYVNKLANFGGTSYCQTILSADSTTVRILDLAIPPGATPGQLKAIYDASVEAAKKGVNVVVHIID